MQTESGIILPPEAIKEDTKRIEEKKKRLNKQVASS